MVDTRYGFVTGVLGTICVITAAFCFYSFAYNRKPITVILRLAIIAVCLLLARWFIDSSDSQTIDSLMNETEDREQPLVTSEHRRILLIDGTVAADEPNAISSSGNGVCGRATRERRHEEIPLNTNSEEDAGRITPTMAVPFGLKIAEEWRLNDLEETERR